MSDEYSEHFITTFSGRKFHYLSPAPEEIDIRDIAHALSMTCRFGGHCKDFYSVAEHSVRVSLLLPAEYRLSGLMHDAHEAYLHDVPRPIKHDMKEYEEFADRIQDVVDAKYGLVHNEQITQADNIMLATEARDLGIDTVDWLKLPDPITWGHLKPLKHGIAEVAFLMTFRRLTEGVDLGSPVRFG